MNGFSLSLFLLCRDCIGVFRDVYSPRAFTSLLGARDITVAGYAPVNRINARNSYPAKRTTKLKQTIVCCSSYGRLSRTTCICVSVFFYVWVLRGSIERRIKRQRVRARSVRAMLDKYVLFAERRYVNGIRRETPVNH